MIHDDVLVVGGGLAGSTAAIAAAREGASVRLITHKENTLRSASGLVDVLGYLPNGTGDVSTIAPPVPTERPTDTPSTHPTSTAIGPLPDPFAALDGLPDEHPYRIVGEETVRDALALFDELVGDRYTGGHTDKNALVPTFGGSIKPTARYPTATAPGVVSRETEMLLVGFETLVDFDALAAAAHLQAVDVPFGVRGVTIRFPGNVRADATVTRYVHALDRNERIDGRDGSSGTTVREALAARVREELSGADRVGFPAILGNARAQAVRASLEDRLGVDVFEVPTGPPSIPGLRLQDTLTAALHTHDVAYESGNPAVGYETDDQGALTSILVDRDGTTRPYHADQFVLATGGLVGRGIETDRQTVRDPVFDCHIDHPSDRYEWFSQAAFGDHAFARFGVTPDDDLRPTDESLEPEYDNLRAAGSVIGGYDFAAEKSGSGVSLATGYHAGTAAANDL